MRKLIYALIPVLLALCSCGGDKNGGNEPLRDIVVTRTLMNHVVNSASGAVDGVNTSDYNIVIDRNNLTADLSTSLTINGAKTAVALHDIKVDYDQDVQWVTFKPSSTLGGSDELTVSGYYDIFNDVIKLEVAGSGKTAHQHRHRPGQDDCRRDYFRHNAEQNHRAYHSAKISRA